MHHIKKVARSPWAVGALLALAVGLAAMFLWSRDARAMGTSGYAQVVRLEIGYVPRGHHVTARVFLASGLTLPYTPVDDADEEMLLKLAHIYATGPTQLFVDLKEDRILAFQLGVGRQ
jgi:hypothetical protein